MSTKKANLIISLIGIFFTFLIAFSIGHKSGYRNGQIDAIHGSFEYKEIIYYQWNGFNYIPIDTIYIKIK